MALILVLAFLALIPLSLIYGTWAWAVVTQKMWLWFIVPAFHMDPINFTQAVAIGVFVSILQIRFTILSSNKKTSSGETDWDPLVGAVLMGIILPWICLVCNWFVKCIFIG